MINEININDKVLKIIQEKSSENITKNLEIVNYNKNDVLILKKYNR